MKLTIRLRYSTRFGQSLFICSDHRWLGGAQAGDALPLHYVDAEFWETTLDIPDSGRPQSPVSYYFILRNADGSVIEDFGGDRKLDPSILGVGRVVVVDSWNDMGAPENVYFTEPFQNVLLKAEEKPDGRHPPARATHWFNVKAPLLPKGQTIGLLGGVNALGQWNPAKAVLLHHVPSRGCFTTQLNLSGNVFPVEYKYAVYDTAKKTFIRFEDGLNRVLAAAPADGRMIVNDGFARLPAERWRGAGVAIPVFSLRSERGFGVGEFLDLPLLADWARRAGLALIQILPVNDTVATHKWMDSYPYSSISSFALHPLYLNLDRVAGPEKNLLKSLASQREELNALPTVDYEAVMNAKLGFLRSIFPAQRESTLAGADCREFCAQNNHWLTAYSAFCYLRDKFGTADFNQWPEHRVYDAAKIKVLAARDPAARDAMDFHSFVQFHLHLQLREAADALHARGLILKGDIAIGVSPFSSDVWQQPGLFHSDLQAGAPPDPFAAKGQNWGFPTYNWPAMRQDGFDWWKRRFAQMSCYFDAFRTDHILGFFRIWSIPRHAVEGILGYFAPALTIRAGDFAARGLAFDRERFTQPFINDAVLREIFGGAIGEVKQQFLNLAPDGRYLLKPEFATQQAVEKHFAALEKNKANAGLKEGLFDLISNVILIEAPDGTFHFRLGMERTASFRDLDPATQARLKDWCIEYFYRRQDDCWRREALEKLPALKRVTNMLICGEDLGMVPACVPEVMRQLGLLGLEIQRMPKALGVDFSRPADAPYLSVVTPSTHDMSTVRGWWLEDRNITQKFYNEELRHPGPVPAGCEPWINREIVRQHLDSPAMWSIFQLQDLLGMDEKLRRADIDAERINVPAIPAYYWRYRLHLTLETLNQSADFTQLVQTMVRQSGRASP